MFRRIFDWYQMKLRGERRIAPQGARGRIYEKKNPELVGNIAGAGKEFSAGPTCTVQAKITRADGTVEYLDLPGSVTKL